MDYETEKIGWVNEKKAQCVKLCYGVRKTTYEQNL